MYHLAMALSVIDARTGSLAAVSSWTAGPTGRDRAVADGLARASEYVGGAPGAKAFVGAKDPGAGTVWVRVAPETGTGEPKALAYLRLKTRYSAPLRADAASLSAAAADLARLKDVEASLRGAPDAASSRAVAAYLHRFRDALSKDYDAPEALACLWDALRPGALSPGSRLALLREASPVLGIP